ncbi:hypothetical protein ACXR0O_12935 [Verrucomicrobiota bacterium sgz303538]
MDDSLLDSLLNRLRNRRGAALPGAFEQNVWREIRLRKSAPPEAECSFWSRALDLILRPQTVAVSLAVALALGVGLGSRGTEAHTVQPHAALDLQVFSSASPSLPSTLLSSRL